MPEVSAKLQLLSNSSVDSITATVKVRFCCTIIYTHSNPSLFHFKVSMYLHVPKSLPR